MVNEDFYHIKMKGGIAQNSITSITEDTLGQMWFGTKNGIVRYNGKHFFIYKNIPNNSNSIGNNFVTNIFITAKGKLWVTTQKGANVFNYGANYFETPTNKRFAHGNITSVAQDKTGKLWFADYIEQSIFSYNIIKGKIEEFSYKSDTNEKIINFILSKNNHIWITTDKNYLIEFIPNKNIFKKHQLISNEEYKKYPKIKSFAANISEDKNGYFWLGTNFGFLLRYNPKNNNIKRFHFKNDFYPRNHLYIMFTKEDREQNLWVGTWFDGIYKLSKERKLFYHYLPIRDNENSLSNNILTFAYQDKAGYLWFGTEFAGVNILKKNKKFFTVANNPDNPASLPTNPYLSVAVDKQNKIWIGTDMGGLLYADKNSHQKFKKFNFGTKKTERIFSLQYDSNNFLWIGTENGLYKYNLNNKSLKHYSYKKDSYEGLSGKNIISLCEDKQGNIWIGSIYKGLTKFDLSKNRFYKFVYDKDNPSGICNNYISSLCCSSEGTIWAGTLDGLCKFNSEIGTFTVFKNDYKNPKSISSNKINIIFEKDNFLWIGTEGGGLNKFDKKKATFKYYLKKDGLPSDNIKGIIDDSEGNLWISTTHNLSKFNTKTEQFVNYGKSDGLYNKLYVRDYGLQELEFFENFARKDKNGNLYFGGISGVYIFNPDSLPQNTYKPPVIIENFSVNGKKMNIRNNELFLKPSQNNFEITLAVHNLIQPEKNQYAYFLENYDDTWHYSGNNFTAEYFNIPDGNYFFHFKGANNDGVWNKIKPIKIIIKPRFHKTNLFYGIIIGFFTLLIFAFVLYKQYIKRQIKNKKELLRYTSSNLSEKFITENNKEMLQLLESKKQYLEPDLSLQKLAIELNTKPNYLSQIINRKHNCNFRDFINKYRIETAKELLLTTSLKIEAVAYDSGFNTLTTFNTAFKKGTGTTPSKFRSENKK